MVQPSLTAAAAQSRAHEYKDNGSARGGEQEDSSPTSTPMSSQPASFVSHQWMKAKNMLISSPGLMTRDIFCLALKYQPPLHVVTSMLQLNEKIAAVPKKGPSALQVAVQSNCNANVLQVIVQANPTALVETNESSKIDPLSYARRFRSQEKDVLQVLSTPLSQWFELDGELSSKPIPKSPPPPPPLAKQQLKRHVQTETKIASSLNPREAIVDNLRSLLGSTHRISVPCVNPESAAMLSPTRFQSASLSSKSLLDSPESRVSLSFFPKTAKVAPSVIQRQEFDNIKILCLSVLKAQKRMQQQIEQLDRYPHSGLETLFASWQEKIANQFQTQLVALDMKEKYLEKKLTRANSKIEKFEHVQGPSSIKSFELTCTHLEKRLDLLVSKTKYAESRFKPQEWAPIVLNNTDPTLANSSLCSSPRDDEMFFVSESKHLDDDNLDEVRSLITEESLGGDRRHQILSPRKARLAKAFRSLFCPAPGFSLDQ